MTKQDDANLNVDNPLTLRSAIYGGGPMIFQNVDDNALNKLRWAGVWTSSRIKYIKNEVVYHLGGVYACTAIETTQEPSAGVSSDWFPISGVMGRGTAESAVQTSTTIGAGWSIMPLATEVVVPLGCLFDLPNNAFEFQWPGAWGMGIYLNLSHNESNGSRSFFVRLFNVTDGVVVGPSGGVQVYVGRNQFGSSFSINPLVYADDVDVSADKQYRVEFGGTSDSFSSANVERTILDLSQVSAQ